MKVIIPAAGYATRLYPLTKDRPKALLEVGGRPMLDHILDQIKDLSIDEIIVVTNHIFVKHFEQWATEKKDLPLTILNDQTTSNEDRLGTVGDLQFAIEKANIDDDVLIIAGDNLFNCDMSKFYTFGKKRTSPIIGVFDVEQKEIAKQLGVVELNESHQIIEFVEKPEQPKSTLIATLLYFIPKECVPMIKTYLNEGNKPDRMGDFATWLIHKVSVFAYFLNVWIDIGSPEQLEEARKKFQ